MDNGGTKTLWTGDEIAVLAATGAETLIDFGIVPLPPGGYDTIYGAARLALEFRGAATVEFDVIQLTMIDSYRYLELAEVAVANNSGRSA